MSLQDDRKSYNRPTGIARMPEGSDQLDAGAASGSVIKNRPSRVVEGPVRSLGWSWFFTLAAVAVFSLAAFNEWMEHGRGAIYAWSLVVGLAYLARRLRAKGALNVILDDQRAPVLYLRSFTTDQLDLARAQFWNAFATEETKLVANLNRIGPVIAIGRPGEKLAHLGAARLYVSDEDWQDVARRLMASARLVVIRAGVGAGLKWELAHTREELPPDKVALWFPGKYTGADYTAFRDIARDTLKVELFEEPHSGFVTFDQSWQPRRGGTVIVPDGGATAPVALRELLARLDINETPPPRFGCIRWHGGLPHSA